jgi:glycosyltransferase involved in cell wall biosynthesis
MSKLRILTWHIHGSYLYYLVRAPHEFYLPIKEGRPEGYGGRAAGFTWPDNVHEVEARDVETLELDCVIFQSARNYLEDQYEILSEEQRSLPKIYLEHDPPRKHPTDTKHIVDDPAMALVHVTHFNRLMWDSGRTPTRVIEHGVVVPDSVSYTGEIPRGIVVVNGLGKRGRRVGADIFDEVSARVPLELVGMESEEIGGRGEVGHADLAEFISKHRFFFNPIRYTSLGLAVCEAMMIGMPVIGIATTEMVRTVENGVSGYVDTDVEELIRHMQGLLANPEEARALGAGARRFAEKHFGIGRFTADWDITLRSVIGQANEAKPGADEGLHREKVARW